MGLLLMPRLAQQLLSAYLYHLNFYQSAYITKMFIISDLIKILRTKKYFDLFIKNMFIQGLRDRTSANLKKYYQKLTLVLNSTIN